MKWFMDNWDGMLLWFVIVLILGLLFGGFGCASNKKEEYYDLLYREPPNVAYKSITIKDYKCEEEC